MVKPSFELRLAVALAVEVREMDRLQAEQAGPRSKPLLVALMAVVRSIAGIFPSPMETDAMKLMRQVGWSSI